MNSKNTYLGKKILYTFVIALCGLIILLNAPGILGVWVVGQSLGHAAVAVFRMVENSTKAVQQSTGKVDEKLVTLQDKVKDITDATQKLSSNVSDKGLVLVLLPEEQEQQLTERADSVRETLSSIKESLSTAVELYRSIDEMPLINLPSLDEDQREQLDQALDETQTQTGALRSAIADFRSGVTDKVDKVDAAASQLNERIQNARNRVEGLNTKMAALEALSIRLQRDIPRILTTISVILSLLCAFVIWTQVELIRQYVVRWKLLGQDEKPTPPTTQPVLPTSESAKPALPAVETPARPDKPADKPAKPAKSVKPAKSPKKQSRPAKKK